MIIKHEFKVLCVLSITFVKHQYKVLSFLNIC